MLFQQLSQQAYAEAKKQVDQFRDLYDNLQAEDKVMDKEFKRRFHDVAVWQQDQLYKLFRRRPRYVNSNSKSTFIALNLCQKADSKAHHTKTLFNFHKAETLQGSAPRRKQEIGNLGWICFSKEVW